MLTCENGRVFSDRRSALASEPPGTVEAFQCRKCHGWHVRTPRKGRRR